MVAVSPFYLVMVFNRLIERGLPRGFPGIINSLEMEEEGVRLSFWRRCRVWVRDVPKLEKTLIILPPGKVAGEVPDEERRCRRFGEMDIIVESHVLFV